MHVFTLGRNHETRFDKPNGWEKQSRKEGEGMGMKEGQENMRRIIRPETSTHYTENVPNSKLEQIPPNKVAAESRRIDKSKLEAQRRKGQGDRP